MAKTPTVADYIAKKPPVARRALKQLRAAIKAAAPGITERISYRIPAFELDGRYLLYIAAFKEHVSVYPVTSGMLARYGKAYANELAVVELRYYWMVRYRVASVA